MIELLAAPPNSLILVPDPEIGGIPTSLENGLIAATPTCVVVRTMTSADGVTRIRVGTPDALVPAAEEGLALIWQGQVRTSTRLAIATVYGKDLVSLPTYGDVDLQIWANDKIEPDELLIMVRQP